ncbi:DUF342 domain-containing protein [Desulfopila aestuarii]|uniref:Flagellar Assembly Protein A N-terminal region domain-containing protein n=1 Tax=Desulfopila aestuarii DSM 18488 TaxID=1121416 RepID=A0A1M7YB64_9BACT|nr:FapA family protein [Desulfopila aestuarii]SHO49875.1 hypothetical protein SAMN02745220_03126 [Desulfopila aestuarii DSM 18488]
MTSLTTHFRTITVTDASCDPPEEIEISELVKPGQLLVTRPDSNVKREETIRPVAGQNTQITKDETGIEATCHGYPEITIESGERGETAVVNVIPLFHISADMMEAHLTLQPPIAEQIQLETLVDLLEQAGVKYGLDTEAIEKALRKTVATNLPVKHFIAARGKAPLHGKDAALRFEVDVGSTPGKELGDGSIDFRERNMFVPVSENQVIARKSPATAGIAGMNLTGEPLAARDGMDLQVKVSEEAIFNEEDGTVRATVSGVLTIVGKDTIRVSAQQKINGDVDFSTGNIRSHDAVHITGSILPEFMVSTKGDLLVGGNIQAATVNSHANVVVKGGILGPTSTLKVGGDADIHHIERSVLHAGGNIIIRGSSYYSEINAGGNIQGADKVKLVGGKVVAAGSITVGQIGSSAAEPIRVAAGTDARRYRRYQEMQQSYEKILKETQSWYTRHGHNKKNSAIEAMEEEMAVIEKEISRFNLIPGTPEDSLGNPDCFYTEAKITVSSRISAGTIIRIGNETTVIKHELGKTRIYLDRATNAITITSF